MSEKKSSYRKLFSNTLLFALGTFSSKVLMILLVSVYTAHLTRAELGINDIIQQIANWLLPLVTMTIGEAVMRFGLEKSYDKKQIFTIGNLTCFTGFAALGVILPIVTASGVADKYLNGYSLLIYIYIVAAALKLVYTFFLRAIDKVKLFAITAILNTLLTLIGTILFIVVLKLGNKGYLWSIILADLLSVVFMLFAARLWQYIELRRIDRDMVRRMFAYSLPLIPAQLMWLVTNSSDSFMTLHYMGKAATGVLSNSYKIANLVSTVYLMFGQAWNMSAVLEDDSDDRDEFYSNVFFLNQCLLYILAAGCLMICKPLTMIWMDKKVWDSAIYAPILIFSSVFACFTTFMNSIYLASNKTKRALATSVVAGVTNITLNIILIPRIGLFGPPITTVVSYLVVFIVRCFDSRSIVPFDLNVRKIAVNNVILAAMTFICVAQHKSAVIGRAAFLLLPAMFVVITAMNIKPVWAVVMRIAPQKIRAAAERIGTAGLIAIAVLAAAFAVVCYIWHIVLTVFCTIAFAAAAAYGIASEAELIKLGGGAGIFLTVWAGFGLGSAMLTLLVLSALEYLRSPSDLVCTVGAVCLIGLAAVMFGAWAAVFTALVVIFLAVVGNIGRVSALLERLIKKTSRRYR